MYNFFNNLFTTLNHQDNHIIIMAVFFGVVAFTVLLRILSHIHFHAALAAFNKDAKKPIERMEDLRKLKSGPLTKAIIEYKRTAEKAVTQVPAQRLADRQVATMSFLGWRYDGMAPFIIELERAVLWIGLILAVVFSDYAFVYGVLALVLFLISRAAAALFDFQGARAQLACEIATYIEREVSRFYATETGGAVLRLKDDLTGAISTMTTNMGDIMKGMSDSLAKTTESIGKTMTEATKSIAPALATAIDEKMVNMNEKLSNALANWESALTKAAGLQTAMNDTSDRLGQASLRLQSSAELLSKHLQGHSGALSEQLIALVSAVESVKEGVNLLSTQQEVLTQQSGYIERNQQALEIALQSYEASLQGLTQSLGDGLGAFINLHAQSSAAAVNEALKGNLDKIIALAGKSGE